MNEFYLNLRNNKKFQDELIPLIDSYLKERPSSEKDSTEFIKTKLFPIAKKFGIDLTVEGFISSTKKEAKSAMIINEDNLGEISGGQGLNIKKALFVSMVLCFSSIS